jgi:hypothetical protein
MEAKYSEKEIEALLQKVRIFNKDIGSYQMFAISENFDYVVKLSNGKILFKIEEIQMNESDELTPDLLNEMAKRFISSTENVKPHSDNTTNSKQNASTPLKKKRKVNIRRLIGIAVFTIIAVYAGIYFINEINSKGYEYDSGDTYQEKVMTIEEIENSQPVNFFKCLL